MSDFITLRIGITIIFDRSDNTAKQKRYQSACVSLGFLSTTIGSQIAQMGPREIYRTLVRYTEPLEDTGVARQR